MSEANFDRGMNIDQVISAPLVAASTANAMMLKDQARFLMEFCFNAVEKKDADGNVIGVTHSPIMINMVMTRSVIDPTKDPNDPDSIKRIEMTFSVPVLTLIPINSLAVDEVRIDFDMEITSQTTSANDSSRTSAMNDGSDTTQLKGKISYDSRENGSKTARRQNSSKLKVHVHAGNLPLPVGVTAMLDMYVKSINPVQTPSGDGTKTT